MRTEPKNPPSEAELQILLKLGMEVLIPKGLDRKVLRMDSKQDHWHPPLRVF